jgi:hypothetical protein
MLLLLARHLELHLARHLELHLAQCPTSELPADCGIPSISTSAKAKGAKSATLTAEPRRRRARQLRELSSRRQQADRRAQSLTYPLV